MKKYIFLIIGIGIAVLLFSECSFRKNNKLEISFNMQVDKTFVPSRQTVIWLEKPDSSFVKSLYVSEYMAYGGYLVPGICPEWPSEAEWRKINQKDFDAVTEATPEAGKVRLELELPDGYVPDRDYILLMEIHLTGKYNILCKSSISFPEKCRTAMTVEYLSEKCPKLKSDFLTDIQVTCKQLYDEKNNEILRRTFITTSAKGALTVLSLPSLLPDSAFGISPVPSFSQGEEEKKIRIGIIGAENTHTVNYGKIFNVEKRFPGVEVLYVWGETEDFARHVMKEGGIPYMVKDPREMLGKIDALIVDHRHAKYHLPAAWPFVEEGVPTFIDKPFCYCAGEGKAFLEMAIEKGTPVTSYSDEAQSNATFDIKDQVKQLQGLEQIVRYGVIVPDIHCKWGEVYFQGVHTIETLMYIFGEDIREAYAGI